MSKPKRAPWCPVCRVPGSRSIKGGPCQKCAPRAGQKQGQDLPRRSGIVLETQLLDMDKIEDMIASCTIRSVEAISPEITLERYANPQTGERVERLTVCRKEA